MCPAAAATHTVGRATFQAWMLRKHGLLRTFPQWSEGTAAWLVVRRLQELQGARMPWAHPMIVSGWAGLGASVDIRNDVKEGWVSG